MGAAKHDARLRLAINMREACVRAVALALIVFFVGNCSGSSPEEFVDEARGIPPSHEVSEIDHEAGPTSEASEWLLQEGALFTGSTSDSGRAPRKQLILSWPKPHPQSLRA